MTSSTPWVEKYRPDQLNDIVLSSYTRQIIENIANKSCNFPNLILYGPPGTGKTTTAINLIRSYNNIKNKELLHCPDVLHLNASDERGIDVVRSQIQQFVKGIGLFATHQRFVILDEADYMTIPAQKTLRTIIQNNLSVRFCIICNYITRLDRSLRDEFVSIRFDNLPYNEIIGILNHICHNEKIKMKDENLHNLVVQNGSDMRTMINELQRGIFKDVTKCMSFKELCDKTVMFFKEGQLNKNEKNELSKFCKEITLNMDQYIDMVIENTVCEVNNVEYNFKLSKLLKRLEYLTLYDKNEDNKSYVIAFMYALNEWIIVN